MKKPRIMVLTGAGISAESGIPTFRGADGLWEGHRIEDVASPEGFRRNPALVLEFYNLRRKAARKAQPNAGHLAIQALEAWAEITVVTQNVDDLHERAGSSNIIHLHGELSKAESSRNQHYVVDLDGKDINLGDLCPKGAQLRPHIIWFGEMVPKMDDAAMVAARADAMLVVGTSLQVYPAAGLLESMPANRPLIYVDPSPAPIGWRKVEVIAEPGSCGVPKAEATLKQLLGIA